MMRPVAPSHGALYEESVDYISETGKKVRETRKQRRAIVEGNPGYDDDIDSTSGDGEFLKQLSLLLLVDCPRLVA
jgi:hypothetical protein